MPEKTVLYEARLSESSKPFMKCDFQKSSIENTVRHGQKTSIENTVRDGQKSSIDNALRDGQKSSKLFMV